MQEAHVEVVQASIYSTHCSPWVRHAGTSILFFGKDATGTSTLVWEETKMRHVSSVC